MRVLAAMILGGALLCGAAQADPYRDESGRDGRDCYDGPRCDGDDRARYAIPRGHWPPPGECRVWFDNRPPGQQPPPTGCDRAYRLAERYSALVVTSSGRVYDPCHGQRWRC